MVTSIKEYGAFVEFNGGQQGLLHISELSHEPVCKEKKVIVLLQRIPKCFALPPYKFLFNLNFFFQMLFHYF